MFLFGKPRNQPEPEPEPKSLSWVRSGLNQDLGFMVWNPENTKFWFRPIEGQGIT